MGEHANRRSFLRGIGTATVGSIALSAAAAAEKREEGFPPSGITTWGDSAPLGDGEVATFASATPDGKPKYVGIRLSEGALTDLPTPEELSEGEEGTELHGGFWSKLYGLSFPEATPAPIEFMGFGWNSEGHLPYGVYSKPHFDIHFYFHGPEAISGIEPRNSAPGTPDPITHEDIADGQIPSGYQLIEGGAVIPNMGAHLAPENAPEFEDRDDASEWLKTLIWGVADIDDDDVFELNFVEPMITVDYLRNRLDGVVREAIPQPEAYPMPGWYPGAYEVRELGDGGYAVSMREFEKRGD